MMRLSRTAASSAALALLLVAALPTSQAIWLPEGSLAATVDGLMARTARIPTKAAFAHIVKPMLDHVTANATGQIIERLAALHTRNQRTPTGLEGTNIVSQEFLAAARGRTDISVEFYAHSCIAQPSVIARIEGSDAPDELVILGAHLDSVTSRTDINERSPGADDDGTGTANLIVALKALVANGFRPKRTVEFVAFAAEEYGLRGSYDLAMNYRLGGKNVVAMLQLDMTGYVKPGTTPSITTFMDFTSPQLTDFVAALIDRYSGLPRGKSQCGYACSDHGPFTMVGFPAAFVAEGEMRNFNPNIHSPNDLPEHLSYEHSAEFAKLAVAFAAEMGLAE